MKNQFNKKVFLGKFILIILLGVICGVSCLFSSQIERALGIGDKSASFSAKEDIVDGLKVHYLDVGQGDCTFIEFPDDTTMMIDASIASYSQHIIKYVQDLGVSKIDYFVLTHSDNDHVGGAKAVFDAFEIANVYRPFQIAGKVVGGQTEPIAEETLKEYYETIYPGDIQVATNNSYANFIKSAYSETYTSGGATYKANVTVTYDGIKIPEAISAEFSFEFFAPLVRTGASKINYEETGTRGYPTKNYGNANDSSPVMLLEYHEKSFIFTGDASETVEKDVMSTLSPEEKERFKNVDVMQAGHHGSRYSNSEEFLALVSPNYFVISCGKDNRYKHPHSEVLERVKALPHTVSDYILITYESGDILFGLDKDGNLVYAANASGSGITVYYWEIALAIFVLGTIIILSVKVTKNKKATAKRAVSTAKKTVNKYANK